jgi:predicted lipid-binding transport protein (Tim44 family)
LDAARNPTFPVDYQTRLTGGVLPTTWMGRLVATIMASALAVAGVFFVAFALTAAAVIATIIALRVWWILRKSRMQRDDHVIEGSYSVESEQNEQIPFSKFRHETDSRATK